LNWAVSIYNFDILTVLVPSNIVYNLSYASLVNLHVEINLNYLGPAAGKMAFNALELALPRQHSTLVHSSISFTKTSSELVPTFFRGFHPFRTTFQVTVSSVWMNIFILVF
jgi:hypothetical protein